MKHILITGANGNLGTACVKKMLEEGHRVVAVDHHDSHLAFAKDNTSFSFISADINSEAAAGALIAQVLASHKKIDAALFLVGGFAAGDITKTGQAEIDKMIAMNFYTAYFLARPLLPQMEANGWGRLVFVGARPALVATQGKDMVAYALSKSLLFSLADMINALLKGKNITATVVVPSTIDTPINRESMPDADPGNWVKPEQLAEAMAFVVSEKATALREGVLKVYNNS